MPTKKSDLLTVIGAENHSDPPLFYNAKAFDGAAVVHLLHINQAATFDDYANEVFIPLLKHQLANCDRIDI